MCCVKFRNCHNIFMTNKIVFGHLKFNISNFENIETIKSSFRRTEVQTTIKLLNDFANYFWSEFSNNFNKEVKFHQNKSEIQIINWNRITFSFMFVILRVVSSPVLSYFFIICFSTNIKLNLNHFEIFAFPLWT